MTEVVLRPARDADAEFSFALMKAALAPYVVETFGPWDEEARRARFFTSLALDRHPIVEHRGERVGCLKVARDREMLRLNRVFLLPSHQGKGIGSRLVLGLIHEADSAQLPIHLRVLRVNPARRLYERLGFEIVGETETHFLMQREPARSTAPR
ncbi:MAG TPA: GNAT family N-acetyltransferase [Myxococcota bacterium]|nr:GNAT family N-acetyltransferase [Myxococcota bacterium]